MNTKISDKGFASVIYFISQAMFIKVGSTQILNSAGNSSIYSILLGSIFSIIILFFLMRLFNYKKDLDLFKKIEVIYGKSIGSIINFVIFILITFLFIYLLWDVNAYVQNKYLDNTPNYIILILFLIPTIWCANLDMKSISKVSFSLFVISVIMILFSATNLVKFIELNNFKPYFNTSFFIVIKNALVFTSYFITPIFMILMTPKNTIENNKLLDQSIFKFSLLSTLNYLCIFIFIIGIFGIELSKIFSYPEYSLMKKINYFDFIQHIENIATIQFLYCLFISNVICLKFIKEYLIHTGLKNIIHFIIIICFIASLFIFKNTTMGYEIVKHYFIYIYFIPIFILILISNIKIKRNKV
ncbi:MAG: GerAB/ArcD/ProY family transporter [Bacilli bacterium]|nr:GerAB/ArcD/ProY family transporter [Bacilli bacterium]MBO6194788.1 GerAB/ArcD/ProY family transporter [Bacilli bacterium]